MNQMDKADFDQCLLRAGQAVTDRTDEFAQLDSRFGDGDHGVSMTKIAGIIARHVESDAALDLKTHLYSTGSDIMAMGGGSASFLWGAFFQGMATPLNDGENNLSPQRVADMFAGALTEMMDVTTARVGDKTLMDTLIPAVDAARALLPASDVDDIFKAMAQGAEKGAEHTKTVAAKFGRAKNYKEQSIGTPDAGAVSMSTFFQGLCP